MAPVFSYFFLLLTLSLIPEFVLGYRIIRPANYTYVCGDVKVTEGEIYDEFFKPHHSPWQRPRRQVTQAIQVNVSLHLSSLNYIDASRSLLSMTGFLSLKWQDELHIWNNRYPHKCIPYLVVPAAQIWLPDIFLVNSSFSALTDAGGKAVVGNNGTVSWYLGGTLETNCRFDLTLFPFDKQICHFQFESLHYRREQLQFHFDTDNIFQYQRIESSEWLVDGDVSPLNDESHNLFDRVEFILHLRRKGAMHALKILVPSLTLSMSQISVFTLHIYDSTRLNLSLFGLAVFSLFTVMVTEKSNGAVPFLFFCLNFQLVCIAISVMMHGFLRILWQGRVKWAQLLAVFILKQGNKVEASEQQNVVATNNSTPATDSSSKSRSYENRAADLLLSQPGTPAMKRRRFLSKIQQQQQLQDSPFAIDASCEFIDGEDVPTMTMSSPSPPLHRRCYNGSSNISNKAVRPMSSATSKMVQTTTLLGHHHHYPLNRNNDSSAIEQGYSPSLAFMGADGQSRMLLSQAFAETIDIYFLGAYVASVLLPLGVFACFVIILS